MKFLPDALRRPAIFAFAWFARDRSYEQARDDALTMQRDGDLDAAYLAWRSMLHAMPDRAFTYCNLIACARELGRLEDCLGHIDEGLRKFPTSIGIKAEAALFEERCGRWESGIAYWEDVIYDPTAHVVWRHCYVHNLLILGRLDEADRQLRVWQSKHPEHGGFLALEAMLAFSRHDLDSALSLWAAYRRKFPHDPVGWEHYGRAYQAQQLAMVDGDRLATIDEVMPEQIERRNDEVKRALLLQFESLGHDCEFGLVQRRFGAEPLGLLRFNTVMYGDLVSAVANGFARMGDPEVTELVTIPNGEYFVQDRRWGLGMHTFVFKEQETAERLYPKLCRRVAFLRDKFLADLAEGRKVLVYTCPTISHDDLAMLHRALRALGPVTLLHVVLGDTGGEGIGRADPATIRDLGDGLLVAHLSRQGRTALKQWDIAFDEWVDVCERVMGMVTIPVASMPGTLDGKIA